VLEFTNRLRTSEIERRDLRVELARLRAEMSVTGAHEGPRDNVKQQSREVRVVRI